jgi:hypothetical protein
MAYLKFVDGVVVPKSTIIAVAFINAANQLGLQVPANTLWVTSGNDRTHMRGSKHYTDEALDFRTKTLSTKDKHALAAALKERLGRNYDVILEDEGGPNEHLHVEHDTHDAH